MGKFGIKNVVLKPFSNLYYSCSGTFFKVVLELFRNCMCIFFGLRRLFFTGIFHSKGREVSSKRKILCITLAFYMITFGANKFDFCSFFESCFEDVQGSSRHCFLT